MEAIILESLFILAQHGITLLYRVLFFFFIEMNICLGSEIFMYISELLPVFFGFINHLCCVAWYIFTGKLSQSVILSYTVVHYEYMGFQLADLTAID